MKQNKGTQPFTKLIDAIHHFWLEQNHDFGVPTSSDLSVTGQPYARLITETPYLDRDMALVGGFGLFESYARQRHGLLYWHTLPTIKRVRNEDGWCYRVEMKLLISDNPIVPRLAAEAMGVDV